MKKLIPLVMMVLVISQVSAQDTDSFSDLNLDFYGFIRNEFFYDSYKGIDAAHEEFYLFPLYAGQDANGEDINGQGSANLQAMATRMGTNIAGPEIFGAKTSGNIEFDFAGIVTSEPTLFRIRKAYAAFQWDKARLLVGQDWHPFWTGSLYPTVSGLNTGAPFQPFNRSPQIRYEYSLHDHLILSGAAVYQLQYTSPVIHSTQNTSGQAKRNGILPEFTGRIAYAAQPLHIGAGISHNRTKPRMLTTDAIGNDYKADEYLTSMSYLGYAQYKTDKLKILAKSVYGQNMKHFLIPGGFGVQSYDPATGSETYTNYNTFSSFLNAIYGKQLQVGAYGGYIQNLGTVDPLFDAGGNTASTYGFFEQVQTIYRISGHLSYHVKKLRLVAEYELTSAAYGTGSIRLSDGLYADTHETVNNRFQLMMMYFF